MMIFSHPFSRFNYFLHLKKFPAPNFETDTPKSYLTIITRFSAQLILHRSKVMGPEVIGVWTGKYSGDRKSPEGTGTSPLTETELMV